MNLRAAVLALVAVLAPHLCRISICRAAADASIQSSDPAKVRGWGDNPFLEERQRRPPAADAGEGELALNGILWDAQSPEAILNGRVLGPGDWIGPWQVVEIRKNRVVVSNGLTTRTLEVE